LINNLVITVTVTVPEHFWSHVFVELVVARARAEMKRESGANATCSASSLLKIGFAEKATK
jgi:hypothetical protein